MYPFSASDRLGAGVRASIDRPAPVKAMSLRPEQKILPAQTVGYPKK